MPIRIERDQDSGNYTPRGNRGSGGGGGGNILFQFLPLLINLFGRNPKLLFLLAILGGGYMLFTKSCGNDNSNSFSTGTLFDKKKYSATEIYEPLADNVSNPLPESFSLTKYAPTRGNQGQQGSCVAWASAYAARTILEAQRTTSEPNNVRFSPSFLYNQIALDGCQGSYLPEALKVMQNKGLVEYNAFPYNDQDCSTKPSNELMANAQNFKINGYQRLSGGPDGTNADAINMLAIKQNIAQGAPVVIGMMVGGTFMQDMMGKDNWVPSDADYNMTGFGGHAMCVVGYDDYRFASNMGGFQIMNSWGEEWGNRGFAWVSYDDFAHFCKEAYGLYPFSSSTDGDANTLHASLGIQLKNSEQPIEMTSVGSGVFRLNTPLKKGETNGDRFKLSFTNDAVCYVYIFGLENDGSVYTLFPYTAKHSPYCGITGTRLFPRDHSLFADDIGNLDRFVLTVAKSPLDYVDFSKKISKNKSERIESRLAKLTSPIESSSGMNFTLDFASNPIYSCIIEVPKN